MTDSTELIVKCRDNCSCLSIDNFYDDEYIITTYKTYHKVNFIKKVKDIYNIIFGKKVVDVEIVLSSEDFNKIRNFNISK